MSFQVDPFQVIKTLRWGHYYSLVEFAARGYPQVNRFPISLRIILEALLRHCDRGVVAREDVTAFAAWTPKTPPQRDVPLIVSRVLLQDFTGVPLIVDLAAMRDQVTDLGRDPGTIEPCVPVDLVIDHSVQVDRARTQDAFHVNLSLEFGRNKERYEFLKWGQQAFKTLRVVPPAMGIVHQVNLEHLASVVTVSEIDGKRWLFPDTLVGTDSHTTMINGLGVIGWGVGGIEAEAAMLGLPVSLTFPEVIGVCFTGSLRAGVTATDLVLHVTELLRRENVVGKFVEFYGDGAASLSVPDRATVANMAPEYGATVGFFPVDEQTIRYLIETGRSSEQVAMIRDYLEAQHLFGMPMQGSLDVTKELVLDLSTLKPSVSGPKRPQDRKDLSDVRRSFRTLLTASVRDGGYALTELGAGMSVVIESDGQCTLLPHASGGTENHGSRFGSLPWSESEMIWNRPFTPVTSLPGYGEDVACRFLLTHGSVVIAAITSCTNTSNPSVMLAAGLLAKKAVEKGLHVHPMIKTSLAPGSRIVSEYLKKSGLQPYLDTLGFRLVGYGCTTCIGNSGPLDERIEEAIQKHNLVVASVLSGNRNFEARIHASVKANYLMSPPLVVAFAIAGRVDIDLEKEPLGYTQDGSPVFLSEIWPSAEEVMRYLESSVSPDDYIAKYQDLYHGSMEWENLSVPSGKTYRWDARSTYIQHPPYLEGFSLESSAPVTLGRMRALALFGDSITTDHISPAGAFHRDSPAGKYLLSLGVPEQEFNSYGSRRGNHHVMVRGTFANVRLRNQLAGEKEGGWTKVFPTGEIITIFEASEWYQRENIPLVVFAGKDYGAGSSRDWAAKGPALLGVRAVIAKSFERIHRSNLIGMGIIPFEFLHPEDLERIRGDEWFEVLGLSGAVKTGIAVLRVDQGNTQFEIPLRVRLDTPLERKTLVEGGVLPLVLRSLLAHK